MSVLTVDVPQSEVNYPLKTEKGLLDRIATEVGAIYEQERIAIITDKNIDHFYGEQVEAALKNAGYDVKKIVLEPGEQTKSMANLTYIYGELVDFNLTRSDLIIAFGGGVIGDLAGYVAATYLRGISFIQIPTTLLAQVDSSVGGKVAVDLPQGKNLVGAFYHPVLVLIDPKVLETLDDSTFSGGMAEVIKYGCIKDLEFLNQLKSYPSRQEIMEDIEEVIATCCKIKRDVVQSDEKDTAERMLLNFGHTVGHAIEAYYNYEKYTHGQAISIGMVEINRLAEDKGISPKGSTEEIREVLIQYGLPDVMEKPEDYSEILPLIKRDKKNMGNQLTIIVLEELGSAKRMKASPDFFKPLLGGV